MRELAQDHGQTGWHAHTFPLSVDGIEIVASLVLLADRRTGRRSGSLPWVALAAGTAGGLAANIATALPSARRYLGESLTLSQSTGSRFSVTRGLDASAEMAVGQGGPESASPLAAVTEVLIQ